MMSRSTNTGANTNVSCSSIVLLMSLQIITIVSAFTPTITITITHISNFISEQPVVRRPVLFMSGTDANANENATFLTNSNDMTTGSRNEPSTVATKTTTTARSARTPSVFLLEPYDPSASLSIPIPTKTNEISLPDQAMYPNMASILVTPSVSSTVSFTPPPFGPKQRPFISPTEKNERQLPMMTTVFEETLTSSQEVKETRMETTSMVTRAAATTTIELVETTSTACLLNNEEPLVVDAAVANERPVTMEEVDLSIEHGNIDIVPDFMPLPAIATITRESSNKMAIESRTALTELDNSNDCTNTESDDDLSYLLVDVEETYMDVSSSFLEKSCNTMDPHNNVEIKEDNKIDTTLLGEINSETSGTNEMKMLDENVDIDDTLLDENVDIDDTLLDISMDDASAVSATNSTNSRNDILDDVDEQTMIMESALVNSVRENDTVEPFLLRYEGDDEVASSELIVKSPSIPPQLSHFVQYQPSIVVAMTREERIALAERSFLSLEVKPGVKPDTIKGAAIATFVLTLLAGDELPMAMFGMVPAVSYFAITRGKSGETIRIIGDLSWLWISKFTEMLSAFDSSHLISFWNTSSHLISFWNTIQSITWITTQNVLAKEEYDQNQSAATSMNATHEPNNVESECFLWATSDHPPENEIENVPLPPAISQSEQTHEKEIVDIRLLLEEAERERIGAQLRCDQKERNQRQLLIAKLETDRQSARAKQMIHDREGSCLNIEATIVQQILSKQAEIGKLNEMKQRSLLETRLSIEFDERNRRAEKEAMALMESERLRFAVEDEQSQARIHEQARIEEEIRLAEQSKIMDLTRIDEKSLRLEEASLLAEMEATAKIKAVKQRVETAERTQLARIEKQTELDEERRIVELSRMKNKNHQSKEAVILAVHDKRPKLLSKNENSNPASNVPINHLAMNPENGVTTGELPWAESRSMRGSSTSDPLDIQKPNVDAAKALLQMDNGIRQTEKECSLAIEDKPTKILPRQDGNNNQPSNGPMHNLVTNLENGIAIGELPWAESHGMRGDSSIINPMVIQKPNVDAAKALLESVLFRRRDVVVQKEMAGKNSVPLGLLVNSKVMYQLENE